MAKKLIYNYTFDASAQTIKIASLYQLRNLVLITNVTDNQIIYNFADSSAGGSTSYDADTNITTITLDYNTTSMSDSDELQILLDDAQDTKIEAGESLLDPVHKFRVSNPENLIDTDFEYGLQGSKWETIELVNNIPSVYTKFGGISIGGIVNVNTILNSQIVTVITTIPHNLASGDPIEIQGTNSRTANGKYVVTKVLSDNSFMYKATEVQSYTKDIRTAYTTIIPGAFFDGSDLRFLPYCGLETDNALQSTISFETDFVHGITSSTSLYVINSVAKKKLSISSTTDLAPDGGHYIGTDGDSIFPNSFYIADHTLSTNDTVYISPNTTDFPGAILPFIPESAAGGEPQLNDPTLCQEVYDAVNTALDGIVSTINGAGKQAKFRHYAYNNSYYDNLYHYYNYAAFLYMYYDNATVNRYHYIYYGSGSNYDYFYLYNSSTSWLGSYQHYKYGRGTNIISTGQAYDIGQHFYRYSGSSQYQIPGFIYTCKSPGGTQYFNTDVDYITEVYSFANPASVNASYDQIWWDPYEYTTKRQYGNYNGTAFGKYYGNKYDGYTISLGDGWEYMYGGSIQWDYNYSWSYQAFFKLNIRLYNTNWPGYYTYPSYYTGNMQPYYGYYGLDLRPVMYSGSMYLIECLVPHRLTSSEANVSTGTVITMAQAANIVAEAAKIALAPPPWDNPVGINTVKAVLVNDNRVRFKTDEGAQYVFYDRGAGEINVITNPTIGGLDDYYPVVGVGSTGIAIESQIQVTPRTLSFDNSHVYYDADSQQYYVNLTDGNTFEHNIKNGQKVVFRTVSGTPPTGLVDGNQYYVRVFDNKYVQLSDSFTNWQIRQNAVTGTGSGSFEIDVYSINGRVTGLGTVTTSTVTNAQVVEGIGTKFLSTFKIGDTFSIVSVGATVNEFREYDIESITSDTTLTLANPVGFAVTGANFYVDTRLNVRADGEFLHRPFDGGVDITSGKSPKASIVRQTRKYFRYQSGKGIQVSMAINFNPARPIKTLVGSGSNITVTTEYPHGLITGNTITLSKVEEHTYYTPITSGTSYDSATGYLTIAFSSPHGFAVNEEIVLTKESFTFTCAKDSHATLHPYPRESDPAGRNARLPILEIPSSTTIVVDVGTSTYLGAHTVTAIAADAVKHIDISNAYNGTHEITSYTDFTFSYVSTGTVVNSPPQGFGEYSIARYKNAGIRAGLFDYQNGFFFEYDGKDLKAVRRSSVQQLSGTVDVVNNSNVIIGDGTQFENQIAVDDYIVIRGQTYLVTYIGNHELIHVQPYYRGTNATGVVVTKTVDVAVRQKNWNIDKADGTGPSGYILDINKIQMAYMDYSWYGAGKIRFGFKDTYGHVRYMHEFIHNNKLNEAYMRTGNVPARYEAFNLNPPNFVPSLFHWGTSVIMDGGFDDDESYLFTASGNPLTFTNGASNTADTTGNSALVSRQGSGAWWNKDWYVRLQFASSDASKFQTGIALYTSDGVLNGQTVSFTEYSGSNFYVYIYISSGYYSPGGYPSVASATTVNIGAASAGDVAVDLTSDIPLISIRLAPSADNNLIGQLGERDIINRMQLKLQELGISVTHDSTIKMILNGSLSNLAYTSVGAPSLSQYIPHASGDSIAEGTTIYSFRASGGGSDSAGKRLPSSSAFSLSGLGDLGNSILGGDGVFPNGPDIITITVSVINTADVTADAAYQVSSRLSWSESQA